MFSVVENYDSQLFYALSEVHRTFFLNVFFQQKKSHTINNKQKLVNFKVHL